MAAPETGIEIGIVTTGTAARAAAAVETTADAMVAGATGIVIAVSAAIEATAVNEPSATIGGIAPSAEIATTVEIAEAPATATATATAIGIGIGIVRAVSRAARNRHRRVVMALRRRKPPRRPTTRHLLRRIRTRSQHRVLWANKLPAVIRA